MKCEYICCIALSLFVSPLVAQTIEYTREDVAENVYAFIPSEIGVGNTVAIIGDAGVLVVDSTATPSGARAVIAEIRKLTPKPVRYLVSTHWHDDHIWGNQAFRAAFPNVEIIAHENTRQDMIDQAIPNLAKSIAGISKKLAARDAQLEERSFIEARLHRENRRLHRVMIRRIANAVQDCQRSHGVSPRLTLAVMIVESHARPSARSSKGAIGLMQVMPHMFEDLGLPGSIAHIESNIEAGCLLLADNIRRLGEDQGISAYFWGRDIRGDAYLGKVKAVRESLDGDRAPAVSAGLG